MWEPSSYQNIKELCKEQKEFGRESEYFKSLLQATFSSNVLVPHDIKNLLSCLLSPAEYILWERAWKRFLRGLLPVLLQSDDGAVDLANLNITTDHLTSEGELAKPQDQAQLIPGLVLNHIKGATEKALLLMPSRSPKINYTGIKQYPKESSIDDSEPLAGRHYLISQSTSHLMSWRLDSGRSGEGPKGYKTSCTSGKSCFLPRVSCW